MSNQTEGAISGTDLRVPEIAEDLIEFVRTFETGEAAANALPTFFRVLNDAASPAPEVEQ